jgi:hypothetical protein
MQMGLGLELIKPTFNVDRRFNLYIRSYYILFTFVHTMVCPRVGVEILPASRLGVESDQRLAPRLHRIGL